MKSCWPSLWTTYLNIWKSNNSPWTPNYIFTTHTVMKMDFYLLECIWNSICINGCNESECRFENRVGESLHIRTISRTRNETVSPPEMATCLEEELWLHPVCHLFTDENWERSGREPCVSTKTREKATTCAGAFLQPHVRVFPDIAVDLPSKLCTLHFPRHSQTFQYFPRS